MKRIGLILALALLAGSALAQTPTATASPTATVTPSPTPSPTITPWNFPLITQHPNGFDERPAINANMQRATVGTAEDPFTTLSLGLNVDLDGTIRIRGGAPSAGDVLTSLDALGSAEWTTATTFVAGSLEGDPFAYELGTPIYYPQIAARTTAELQLPLGTMYTSTNAFSVRGFNFAARGRGSIGSLGFLNANDWIGGQFYFAPYGSTTWTAPAAVIVSATDNHTTGTYSVGMTLLTNDILELTATNRVNISATTTTMTTNLIIDTVGPGDGYLFVGGNAYVTGNFQVDAPSQATFGGAVQLGSSVADDIYNQGTFTNDQRFATGYGVSLDAGNADSIAGTTTLVAGTVTVSTTRAQAGYPVSLTVQAAGGTQGFLSITNIVANTSFDILSTSATETSTVYWEIHPNF